MYKLKHECFSNSAPITYHLCVLYCTWALCILYLNDFFSLLPIIHKSMKTIITGCSPELGKLPSSCGCAEQGRGCVALTMLWLRGLRVVFRQIQYKKINFLSSWMTSKLSANTKGYKEENMCKTRLLLNVFVSLFS